MTASGFCGDCGHHAASHGPQGCPGPCGCRKVRDSLTRPLRPRSDDAGDGWAGRARAAEDYAALLLHELDQAVDDAHRFAGLLQTAIEHHRQSHPDCWETP